MNLAHRHQSDDMYEVVPMPAFSSAQQYFSTDRKRRSKVPITTLIDTGLEEAPQVAVTRTSKHEPAILEPLQRAVDRLKALRMLEPGWDSYSATVLNRATIRPALELVLRSIHQCAEPRINATAAGGIDMIWETGNRALEIGLDGGGRFDCLFIIGEDEDEVEGGTIEDATLMLERFCRQ